MSELDPLAVSMGEPAGIGPDLILSLYNRRTELDLPPFIVFGNAGLLRDRAARLGLDIQVSEPIASDAAEQFQESLPVVNFGGRIEDEPATPSTETASIVMEAIAGGVSAVLTGACRALVTAPIHKAVLKRAGFKHPGHTEYLAELCKAGGKPPMPVMMLTYAGLRTVPLTIHVPLAEVPSLVTIELIVRQVRIINRELIRRFDVETPKIAVAGMNPHAGEDGEFGREDIEQIKPAVRQLQDEGLDVTGPLPADTLFYPKNWKRYDVVVAMYHDQALIPIKTIAFDEAVNVTLGLPIIRTSPDHGTAFDLAGSGKASSNSMLAAIRLADQMSAAGK